MELLNIRFSFFCRSSHENEQGKNPIVLRISFRGERKDIFTGLYCIKEHWDSPSGLVLKADKTYRTINENLKVILQKATLAFDGLKFFGVPFTIHELVAKIKGDESKPVLLLEYLELALERGKEREGVDISKATFFKYRRSIEHVKEFLESHYRISNISLHKIDIEFLTQYFLYLRKEKNISHNVVLRYFQFFKSFLLPAIKSGILKRDPFLELKYKRQQNFVEYLSQEEIDKIAKLDLASADLDRVRDIFLFACYTGLAYVDIKQLKSEHIILDADDTLFIRKPRQKTGQESIVPLLSPAIRILKKYSLTGNLRDLGWYISSNQKMNMRLKKIGQLAGITKELHMHLARHTFATTVTLSNGIPLETVSHMLGHASIKQTQHYARIVARKVKKDMLRLSSIFE
jgi:site-specific recombinase XerD